MPLLTADDGARLYYEETGSGIPILFIHEFAGDCRSWELQVRCFARRYRCITYNARGFPPSDVPADDGRYSQERARDVIRAVLDALLAKYQDEGVLNLDDPRVLQISPFDRMGTPVQLVKAFGGKDGFEHAVHELQSALYEGAA